MVLHNFFLLALSHIHYAFIRKRQVKGMVVRRFVTVLITLFCFSSPLGLLQTQYLRQDISLFWRGWDTKHSLNMKHLLNPFLFSPAYTLEVSCRYIMSQLSFLSMEIAVVFPRKWCRCKAMGNEILSSMKRNFTERLKNLFSVWQICYTTYKYIKYKNNKIDTCFMSTKKKSQWLDNWRVNLCKRYGMANIALHKIFFLVRIMNVGVLIKTFMSLWEYNDRSKSRRDLKWASSPSSATEQDHLHLKHTQRIQTFTTDSHGVYGSTMLSPTTRTNF